MAVTISGTSGIAVPLGSAGAPGVSNTTSATTGIYNPTSTTLALATNGTNAVTIDASQNMSVVGTLSSGAITSSGLVTGTTGALYPLVSGTAQASTSGTSIDFTSIPSWVKRITVMFNGVSTNGTSVVRLQLGDSGGIETTGYTGVYNTGLTSGGVTANFTAGVDTCDTGAASFVRQGTIVFTQLTGNTWTFIGGLGQSDTARYSTVYGSKTLSDTLTQVRITTVNGTDTFDAGSINILYE